MLSLSNVSFGYTDKKLFNNINVDIFPNDKIGLVGKNGSGKTTLLRILADEIKDYDGQKVVSPKINIGFLPQEINFLNEDFSPFTLCKQAFKEVDEKIKKIEELSTKIEDEKKHIEYDNLLSELTKNNMFSYEYKIRMILTNLGLSINEINLPFFKLSSGLKVRAYLAYLMLIFPDILMLDEPTNYLDIDAIQYLIQYLKNYEKSFIIISHDKNLLDSVTNKIWDLFASKLYIYSNSNYTSFIQKKEEYLDNLEKKAKNLEIKIKENMEFINRFRAKESKASSVQSRLKMLEKMEKIEIPKENVVNFKIKNSDNTFSNILSCENLSFGYSEENLLDKLHFSILRGDRIFLIGRNGIGKTTFLKILVGQLKPKIGKVVVHNNSKIGYFEQNASLSDDLNSTVLQYFSDSEYAQQLTENKIRTFLGNFGFIKDEIEKKICVLSGGEKVRLILAKIFLSNPDILILDEPTTHLDITTKDILIENLLNYNGAILAVSHDIDFIKRLALKYVTLEQKNLLWLKDLSEYFKLYENKYNHETSDYKLENKIQKSKLSTNKRQQIEKQIVEYEKQLLSIEKQIEEIEKKFSENLSFVEIQKVTEKYNNLQKEYEQVFAKLEQLENLLKN